MRGSVRLARTIQPQKYFLRQILGLGAVAELMAEITENARAIAFGEIGKAASSPSRTRQHQMHVAGLAAMRAVATVGRMRASFTGTSRGPQRHEMVPIRAGSRSLVSLFIKCRRKDKEGRTKSLCPECWRPARTLVAASVRCIAELERATPDETCFPAPPLSDADGASHQFDITLDNGQPEAGVQPSSPPREGSAR